MQIDWKAQAEHWEEEFDNATNIMEDINTTWLIVGFITLLMGMDLGIIIGVLI